MEAIIEARTDYRGREYANFVAARPMIGTGWIVKGYALDVSAVVSREMARPHREYRKTSRFNGKVKMGWKTKREAQSIADLMNEGSL